MKKKNDEIKMKNFNTLFESVCKDNKNVVSEGFLGSLGTGAVLGGGIGATTATLGAVCAGACAPIAAGAGLTIGVPLGAIIGTGMWLKHLIKDKIAKPSDSDRLAELIKKIDDGTISLNELKEVDELKKKYDDDIKKLAGKSDSDDSSDK